MNKPVLSLLLLLMSCQSPAMPPVLSQTSLMTQRQPLAVQVQTAASAARKFPADWQGTWAGRCSNTGPGGKQTYAPVDMRLTILPKPGDRGGSWQWKIEYKSPEQNQVRDYTLKPVDAPKGQWLIDEHNGILLDNFTVSGDLMLEQFSVGQTLIFGRHQLLDAQNLKVELVSFSLQGARNSGAEPYPVSSFKLLSVQDCPLKLVAGGS